MYSRFGLSALLISILFISYSDAFAAKKKAKNNQKQFYKYMEGAFEDGTKIYMNLTKDDSSAYGNCYFANEKKTISFFSSSRYDAKNATFYLEEFENYDEEYNPIISGIFTGKITADTLFAGTWTNNKNGIEKKFTLKQVLSPYAAEFEIKNFTKSFWQEKGPEDLLALISYTYPIMQNNGNTQVQQKINDVIMNTILEYENYEGDKIRVPSLEIICNEFIKAYKDYAKEMKDAGEEYGINWYDLTSINVVYNSENIVSMEHTNNSFTGGAHGSEYLQGLCFNLETGERIILEDLFGDGYDDVLDYIGEQEFRKVTGTADNEPLTERWWFEDNKFHLNNNFVLLQEGIKFNFVPYEVGSYAEGLISFVLPYSKLNTIIRRDGLLKNFVK